MDEADLDHERARVAQKLRLRPQVLTASAKTGRHVQRAAQRGDRRSPTGCTTASRRPQLNRFLAEVVQARQPPAKQGHRLKLLYMAQIETAPPRFSIQVNSRNRVTRDYAYFIENRLRERYGMDGVPLIIDFVERKPPARRALLAVRPEDASTAAAATLCDPMNQLSDNEYLFTSESVTEGHPDKIADQISDGVLDAVLRDDPYGRVACETLVNTGLVVVSGEISTDDLRRHPGHRARDDPQDRLHRRRPRLQRRLLRGHQRDRQAVARHRPGRRPGLRGAHRRLRRRRARRRRRGRPGDDVRLRVQRDAGAHAAADLAGPQAGQAPGRRAQGRGRAVPAPGRQDPGHGALPATASRSRSRRSSSPPSTATAPRR